MDLITIPKCTVSLTGARFDDGIPFEDWAAIGKRIIRIAECSQWLIGDWLNFGWSRYVENAGKDTALLKVKYKVALETLPYQYGTLANFSWVAKSVEFSRRREKLSFKHHTEVAQLKPELQSKYLALAEKNDLNCADLRQLIRANEAETTTDANSEPNGPSPVAMINRLWIWCKQQDPTDWPKKRRDAVKSELAPLVEFYNRL